MNETRTPQKSSNRRSSGEDLDEEDEKKTTDEDVENALDIDTIFQPPSPMKRSKKLEDLEELEWTQHRVSTLPLEQLDLNSESIRVALEDFPEKDALKDWLSRVRGVRLINIVREPITNINTQKQVLNTLDKKNPVPHNLQRGLELKNLSPTVRDSFLLLIVPMLQRLRNIKLKIWKRSRVDISSDLRLRLEHHNDE